MRYFILSIMVFMLFMFGLSGIIKAEPKYISNMRSGASWGFCICLGLLVLSYVFDGKINIIHRFKILFSSKNNLEKLYKDLEIATAKIKDMEHDIMNKQNILRQMAISGHITLSGQWRDMLSKLEALRLCFLKMQKKIINVRCIDDDPDKRVHMCSSRDELCYFINDFQQMLIDIFGNMEHQMSNVELMEVYINLEHRIYEDAI